MHEIAILGGGVAGLTAAYELAKRGKKVLVLEKENEIGGIARSFTQGGFILDYGPHSFWNEHRETKNLMKEAGLNDKVYYRKLNQGVFYNDRLYDYSKFFDILRLLPMFKRLPIFLIKIAFADEGRLRKESAKRWIVKEIGINEYEGFFKPLLYKRFRQDPASISALDLRAIFKSMLVRGREFYLKGGMRALPNALAGRIVENGGIIKLKSKAVSVKKDKDGFVIKNNTGVIKAKILIAAIPLPVLKKISNFNLPKVRYFHSVCMYFGVKKQVTNLYAIITAAKEFPFQRICNPTRIYIKKASKGLIMLDKYMEELPEDMVKEEEKWVASLEKIFPNFSKMIEWSKTKIIEWGLPITKDYEDVKLTEGLFLAGHFDKFKEFAGIERAVLSGKKAAKAVLQYIR